MVAKKNPKSGFSVENLDFSAAKKEKNNNYRKLRQNPQKLES